jgi:hypothetical protein
MSPPIPFVPRGQTERLERLERLSQQWRKLSKKQQGVILTCVDVLIADKRLTDEHRTPKKRATILPFRPTNRE